MCAVPNMAVFCSSLNPCFLGMLLTYFLNDFEIVPVAPIITGITFVFTFHMHCICIVRSLYFRIFSASFLITLLSAEIATSINIHVPFSLSWIIMSGLLLVIVLSVCTCWFHNMVTLPPWLVSTDFGTCSYQCFFVQLYCFFPCICWSVAHTVSCYYSLLSLCRVFTIMYLRHCVWSRNLVNEEVLAHGGLSRQWKKERKEEALSVTVARLPKLRQNENIGPIILTASFLLIYMVHAVIVAC